MKIKYLKTTRTLMVFCLSILAITLILSPSLYAQNKERPDTNISEKIFNEMNDSENSTTKRAVLENYEKRLLDNSRKTAGISQNLQVRSLGDTIAQTFPDAVMAQAVADNVAAGNINTIIDQTMIDETISLNLSNRGINSIEGISVFNNLNSLYLDRNNLSSIPVELESLDYLTLLVLDFNYLNTIPQEVTNLSNLRFLSIDSNNIYDIPVEVSNLSNLWYLSLVYNKISVITPELLSIQNLEYLDLRLNEIAVIPPGIENLTNLQHLNLAANKQIPEMPLELFNLNNLKHLDISYNYSLTVIPSAINQLTNLEYLDLSGNNITQMTLTLFDVITLREIYITDNNIVEIPSDIGKLSNLEYLRLNSNQIPEIPVEICNLPNLEYLGLGNNKITEIPKEFEQFPSLVFLTLERNSIVEVPKELGNLSELKYLFLNENKINDLPTEIGNLSNLEYFELQFNKIKLLPSEIGNLSNLKHFNIGYNEIKELPTEIINLSNLDYFQCNDNQLISLTQPQYDFLIQLDNKYPQPFPPMGPSGSFAQYQQYTEVLDKIGHPETEYRFKAHPAYEQFPNYGVVFSFNLLLPDGTTKEITPIFKNGEIVIPDSELLEVGEYCFIATEVRFSKLYLVEYKSYFTIAAEEPALAEPIVYISAQANGEKDKVTSTSIKIEVSRIPEAGDLTLENISMTSVSGNSVSINKESLKVLGNNQYEIAISGNWKEGDLVDVTLNKEDVSFVPETRQTLLHKNLAEGPTGKLAEVLPKTGNQLVALGCLLLISGIITTVLYRLKSLR